MLSMTSPPKGQNLVLIVAVLGLFGWELNAAGQSVFDPYQPDSSPYNSSSFPSLPNNLALPGQAREAREYQSYDNGRGRFGTFDRYVNGDDSDNDSDSFVARRRGGIGVPYYEVARQSDRAVRRDPTPIREADKAFYAFEAEKNRRYLIAIKEKDPVKRAKLLREVSRMQAPQSSLGRGTEPRKTPARRAGVTRPSTAESLAAEALIETKPAGIVPDETGMAPLDSGSRVKPASPSLTDPRSINARRAREAQLRNRRPPLPTEPD